MHVTSYFVATSPLQLINCMNIQSVSEHKVLLVTETFYKSFEYCSKIRHHDIFNEVHLFSGEKQAYDFLRRNVRSGDYIFIDSDINKKNVLFSLRKARIFVYEEGVGTYLKQHHIYRRRVAGFIHRQLFRILGYQNRRGGDRYVNGLILYLPDFYTANVSNAKPVHCFQIPFLDHLEKVSRLFLFDVKKDDVIKKDTYIIIEDWEGFAGRDLEDINIPDDARIVIKRHPHYQFGELDRPCHREAVIYAPRETPVELIIQYYLKMECAVTVISRYSTGALYFEALGQVRHIKLKLDNTIYTLTYDAMVRYLQTQYNCSLSPSKEHHDREDIAKRPLRPADL